MRSCHWLVLFVQPESKQRGVCNLGDGETYSWNITDGVTRATETDDEDFVVLVDKAHTTIARNVGSNSLVVLFELHSHALTHGRVWLLCFDTDLLNNNACSHCSSCEGLLPFRSLVRFFVLLVSPSDSMSEIQLLTC